MGLYDTLFSQYSVPCGQLLHAGAFVALLNKPGAQLPHVLPLMNRPGAHDTQKPGEEREHRSPMTPSHSVHALHAFLPISF